MRVLEKHELKIVTGGEASAGPDFGCWGDVGLDDVLYCLEAPEGPMDSLEIMDWIDDGVADSLRGEWVNNTAPTDIPASPEGSIRDAIVAGLFAVIGIDTGFDPQTGLRRDGLPAGSGCGDVDTDWIVPDKMWGIDLTPACRAHDENYNNQVGQTYADNVFREEVIQISRNAGAPDWAAEALGFIYYQAVSNLGGGAYAASSSGAGAGGGGGGGGGGNPIYQIP